MAQSFLMIPDLFHWLLTGVKANEYTNATTTQFLNPKTGKLGHRPARRSSACRRTSWARSSSRARSWASCSRRSPSETDLAGVEVILPGTHDTASAVAAVPAASKPGAAARLVLHQQRHLVADGRRDAAAGDQRPRAIELNFTNEGGVGGTTRLLKNIAGLWLVQECRRDLEGSRAATTAWEELMPAGQRPSPLHAR